MDTFRLLVAPFALVILFSCGSDPVKKGTCSCTVSTLTKSGNNVYYNVVHFDLKNKDCYSYLRAFGKKEAKNYKPPVTLHFLDQVGTFSPPSDGTLYGSESIRKGVICQYLLMANLNEMVSFDPFGYGAFEEPQ